MVCVGLNDDWCLWIVGIIRLKVSVTERLIFYCHNIPCKIIHAMHYTIFVSINCRVLLRYLLKFVYFRSNNVFYRSKLITRLELIQFFVKLTYVQRERRPNRFLAISYRRSYRVAYREEVESCSDDVIQDNVDVG